MSNPVSRQSSLETNLFAPQEGARGDPNAEQAIAALVRDLQGNSGIAGLPIKREQPNVREIDVKSRPKTIQAYNEIISLQFGDDPRGKALIDSAALLFTNKINQDNYFARVQQVLKDQPALMSEIIGLGSGILKYSQPTKMTQPTKQTVATKAVVPPGSMGMAMMGMNMGVNPMHPMGNPTMGVMNQMGGGMGMMNPTMMHQPGMKPLPNRVASPAPMPQRGMPPMPMVPGRQTPYALGDIKKMIPAMPTMMPPNMQMMANKPVVASVPSHAQPAHPNKATIIHDDEKKLTPKDLNNVTVLAGIDIKKETENILGEEPPNTDKYNEPQEANLISSSSLKRKVMETTKSYNFQSVHDDVLSLISLAVQEHLRSVITQLSHSANHRLDVSRGSFPTKVTSDVKSSLHAIEQRENLKRKRTPPTTTAEPAKPVSTTPNLFTPQNLAQWKQLQTIVGSGGQLTPTQQQVYDALKHNLQKLHYQQLKLKQEQSAQNAAAAPPRRKITLKDVLSTHRYNRCHTFRWRTKRKSAQYLL
eukprot:TRINITY_DN695_c0_g1_i1.p1 TRINITY_DN695_c0_g1~~TRINITY_DN695_c0_g1_i1.p1  ORF type:complete len:555 (+),score=118.31 TRINITY_DN695_c0_g1_i1:73-1665(+)